MVSSLALPSIKQACCLAVPLLGPQPVAAHAAAERHCRCAAEVPLPATVESPVDDEEGPQDKAGEPEKWLELGLNTVG